MSLRKQTFAVGDFYHLYNRGTDKRIIFLDEKDYSHFLLLMYICNTFKNIELRNIGNNFDRGEPIVSIGAYCLIPNHFHFLVCEKVEGGISKYMLKLMTAYSMYFNKRYERSGKLYEGIFKSSHLNNNNYLKYIYSYIHLNSAKIIDKDWKENSNNKTRLLKYVFDYKYSSLTEYSKDKFKIVTPKDFPKYFQKPEDHKTELCEWLNFNLGRVI